VSLFRICQSCLCRVFAVAGVYDMFSVKRFILIGIDLTKHGSKIATALLEAGERPLGAVISTWDHDLVRICEPFRKSWREPTAAKELAAMIPAQTSDDAIVGIYKKYNVPFIFVDKLSSDIAVEIIKETGADTALLAEGPILKGPVLGSVPQGIVNFHAAPLPACRGNYATYWALYNDVPLEVSAHIVSAGIDTGDILMKTRLPVFRGDTLTDIDSRGYEVAGALAVALIRQAKSTGIKPIRQERWEGTDFRGNMPEDIIQECARRLAAGEYGFYE